MLGFKDDLMKSVRVLAIIPAYNEAESIVNVAQGLRSCALPPACILDILVIDDGSSDNTTELCKQNNIPVATLPDNLGIGGAVQCGYIYAFENN
jgi:glycosyltransferase involved in cell wall biosynthesis